MKKINEPVFEDTFQMTQHYFAKSSKHRGLLKNFVARHDRPTVLAIKNTDCIDECLLLKSMYPGKRIGLLNMASDRCPGGGVKKGCQAREEDVCRRTSLYHTLTTQTYPMQLDEIIYSEDVYIVKSNDYRVLSEPVKIDGVLSIAALRAPGVNGQKYASDKDRAVMLDKIRLMLQTASYYKLDCLVLGAWGCGAFGNPPHEIARLFKIALREEFKNSFHHITFSIREMPDRVVLNPVFKHILMGPVTAPIAV